MIVVTGAAGFIGSVLARALNNAGHEDLVLVDDFSDPAKKKNWEGKKYRELVDLWKFEDWLKENTAKVSFIFHLGGNSSTTVFDNAIFEKYNIAYSKMIWNLAAANQIPMVYASSAATYGDGSAGYSDEHAHLASLKPLNPYGQSKHDFDLWALKQKETPPSWAGLKFFDVYGPNDAHKGRMSKVPFHVFNQIKQYGKAQLFKSHRPEYKDGEQARDYVYVKDVADVMLFMMRNRPTSGIYNVGTGQASTFNAIAQAVFSALELKPNIEYIDIPPDIRDKYQYFTEANISKLRLAGYSKPFTALEDGVHDYVQNHLLPEKYF